MDYFDVKAMNSSTIKAGAKSMLYMNHIKKTPVVATPAMITGTQRHMALLEPEKFADMYIYDGSKRVKEYKELKKEYGAENIMGCAEHRQCIEAAEVARAHPIVKEMGLLADGGIAEKEFYWDEPQGKAKAKIDYLLPDRFVEYKTTASLDSFHRTAENLHYHLGLAWYWRACGVPGIFIVQEAKAPFDVAVFEVHEYKLQGWFDQCTEIWDKYLDGANDGAYTEPIMFEPVEHDDGLLLDFEA